MLYLDYLAYHNRLKNVSIGEKLLLGGGGLLLSLAMPRPITLLTIAALMHLVMLAARIPLRYLLRLWLAPLIFLLTGLVTVLVSIGTQPFAALCSIRLGEFYLGVTSQGLTTAQTLLLRSLASVSCLFMIATTTPVAHIAAYAARYKAFNTVMEIMLLTYRFIFVFLETAGKIYTAQQSRLGYCGLRRSLHSLAMLAANLGRKSFLTARELYTSLQARNYTDRLVFRCPRQKIRPVRLLLILAALIGTALTACL